MLTAVIGGAMIGVGGKMLWDKAVIGLAKLALKKAEAVEVKVEVTEAEAEDTTTEAINDDEVE